MKIASSGEPDQDCALLASVCSYCLLTLRSSGGNTLLSYADDAERVNDEGRDDGRSLASVYDDHLTPAERRFLQQREKIELERLAKMASKSHRDRVQEFNQYLANLSEHYDIPKVGPG